MEKLTDFSDATSDFPDMKGENTISVRNVVTVECAAISETVGYLASHRQEVKEYYISC